MSSVTGAAEVSIRDLQIGAYEVPTDAPEADGTLSWDSTVIVVVEARAGDAVGIGYTYADPATAKLAETKLAPVVQGLDALAPQAAWRKMVGAIRNLGRPGISSMAIAAIDTALWDLKARLLDLPLCRLLGGGHECVPVYGSGGFTAYDDAQLGSQLAGWVEQGIPRVKIKVGSHPDDDPRRVRVAREAIGPDTQLFVDANGAYSRKQALELAEVFRAQSDVSWFEEPVSSDDLDGLRLVRDRAPSGMDVAAGEYGYDAVYFRRMLEAGAVDVQQADITRCAGVTGLMQVAGLCEGFQVPLSLHCGPSIHVHPALSLDRLLHLEYFHDHVRIEEMLFEGVASLEAGALWPDLERPGNGLEFKREDAERYAV